MFCGNCGERVDQGFAYCPSCGSKVATMAEPAPVAQVQSPVGAQLPGNLGQAVRLGQGEWLLKLYKVRKLDPRRGDPEDDDSRSGVLVITNQRLVFVEEHGILNKKMVASETIPFAEIGLIDVAGFLSKNLSVNYARYNLNYVIAFDQFKELDPMTLKGTQAVTLYQAQQVVSQAVAVGRGQVPASR